MTIQRMDNVLIVVEDLDTAVDDVDDTVSHLHARGGELVGDIVQFEDSYRLCCLRGPENLVIGLAQSPGPEGGAGAARS